jgi:hypothetical protein
MLLLDTLQYPAEDRAEVLRTGLVTLAGVELAPMDGDDLIKLRYRAWDLGRRRRRHGRAQLEPRGRTGMNGPFKIVIAGALAAAVTLLVPGISRAAAPAAPTAASPVGEVFVQTDDLAVNTVIVYARAADG